MNISTQFRFWLIAICASICLAITPTAQGRRTSGHPNFSGKWQLNHQQSDKPEEKMKEAIKSKGGMAGTLGRVMSGRGGKMNERMKNNVLMAESLRIIHNDPEFQIIADNETGASKTFFTDGRPVRTSTQIKDREVNMETTARWQGEQLVVVTQTGQGGKRTLNYKLAQGGKQMIVLTQITNPKLDQPIEIRLVYDAEDRQ